MCEIPIWEKYSLSIIEASQYFGVGTKKLYDIVRTNPNADFILEVGSHVRIKRGIFQDYLDKSTSI